LGEKRGGPPEIALKSPGFMHINNYTGWLRINTKVTKVTFTDLIKVHTKVPQKNVIK